MPKDSHKDWKITWKNGLNCMSLNADNLRNKLREFSTLTYIPIQDVSLVQEFLPKNTYSYKEWHKGHSIRQLQYWSRRRVHMGWSATQDQWQIHHRSEYCSTSTTREASVKLFDQIRYVSHSQPSHLLITGDFNPPDNDWDFESSPNSLTNLGTIFMECYRDCFLYQHVMAATHHR